MTDIELEFKNIAKYIKEITIVEIDDININVILDEINFKNYNSDISVNIEQYKNYKIIGYMETSSKLKDKCFDTDIVYLYFVTDMHKLYIALEYLHPYFWQEIDIKNIENIIKIYNQENYHFTFNKIIRGYIGTEKTLGIDLSDIEEIIMTNDFCEFFMWGSNWIDFPYREQIMKQKYSRIKLERMLVYALKQNPLNRISIAVRTKASKSIIKFEYYNGAYFIEIHFDSYSSQNYNSLDIKNLSKLDIPLDIIGILHLFDTVTYQKLFNIKPLEIHHISLALQLITSNKDYMEIIELLNNINNDNEINDEVRKYAYETKNIIEVNLNINKIDSNQMADKINEIRQNNKKDKLDVMKELSLWICEKINIDTNNEFAVNHIINISEGFL